VKSLSEVSSDGSVISDSSFDMDDSDRKLWEEVSKKTGESVGTMYRAFLLAVEAVEAGGRADMEQGFYSLDAHPEHCVNLPIPGDCRPIVTSGWCPVRERVMEEHFDKYTLLHLAVSNGHFDFVEELVDDKGADVNACMNLVSIMDVCSYPEIALYLSKCGLSEPTGSLDYYEMLRNHNKLGRAGLRDVYDPRWAVLWDAVRRSD
jgi:hypothetical protein